MAVCSSPEGVCGLAGATSGAEIYDPASGLRSAAASMRFARATCSAILLDDGRSWWLVAIPAVASEGPPPRSMTPIRIRGRPWSRRGPPKGVEWRPRAADRRHRARERHAAQRTVPRCRALRPDHRRLAGTQAMVMRIRLGHTSTLLEDGSVLVTGGEVPPSAPSAPYTYLKQAELYVPAPSPALRPRP